jgi:hypothetical protein
MTVTENCSRLKNWYIYKLVFKAMEQIITIDCFGQFLNLIIPQALLKFCHKYNCELRMVYGFNILGVKNRKSVMHQQIQHTDEDTQLI